ALLLIGGDQAFGRLAAEDHGELPDQVVGVLDAAIAAARAEGRDDVRAVAGEDHAAMHEAVDALALEGVDRHPVELEIAMADDRLDARDDVLRLLLLLGIRIPAELEVDAVDVVRLLVQQRRLTLVKGRLEPEPALGGEVR